MQTSMSDDRREGRRGFPCFKATSEDRHRSLRLHNQTEHHGATTQPASEYDHYEAWRDLQDVLEERDAEWWAEQEDSDEENSPAD